MSHFRFGTVGAPLSTPKKPGGSVGSIQQIAALELDAFELGWVQSVRVTPASCLLIKEVGKEKQVALSVHAPYFINLNAADEEWPKSRQRLWDAAFYGSLAGATDIVFHPGSYFEQPIEAVLAKAIPRLQELVNELNANNIFVVLRPETMGKIALLGSIEDTLAISKSISGVAPCLDFAHLHARQGNGSCNTRPEWIGLLKKYEDTLGTAAMAHLHIHLSGIEYTTRGEKNHLPIQESDLNLPALFEALHEQQCAGRILCESPLMEEDALFMKKTWIEISGE
jgi:deoxyribonuclease IV